MAILDAAPAKKSSWLVEAKAKRASVTRYRGPDRRGLIHAAGPHELWRVTLGPPAALAVLPLLGIGLIAATSPWISVGAWSTGVGDLAFVAFFVGAALLALYWRLAGEAAGLVLAARGVLIGFFVVPALSRPSPPSRGFAAQLLEAAVLVTAVLSWQASRLPEVDSALRPRRCALVVLAALAVAMVVFLLVFLAVGASVEAAHAIEIGEAALCAAAAASLSYRAARTRRPLLASGAPGAMSLAGALAIAGFGWSLEGPWSCLPALLLAVGGLSRLWPAGSAARNAMATVVVSDLRGRRRWEAAEGNLAQVKRSYQGQRHDIATMLSAMDGALLLLAAQGDHLSSAEVEHLVRAARDELAALRSLLSPGTARPYDLSALLSSVAAVRSTRATGWLRTTVEPGLGLLGHPDRVAAVIDNLLANAAIHAQGSQVELSARPIAAGVEIVVSDHGPGLPANDLERAFERGWRGGDGAKPGDGLGLYQCKQLVEAEGGSISLGSTDDAAPAGQRGLTARVVFQARTKYTIL